MVGTFIKYVVRNTIWNHPVLYARFSYLHNSWV